MAKVNRVTIEKNRCKGCALCVNTCPKQVLAMSKEINDKGYFYASAANPQACIGCRFCAFMCPDVAITIEQEETAQKEQVNG
ncbi:MAG TPA: 4Fe-4S dicluster domain-containing protein [bacterium]|nr:4Fe-4S dicluster domain-containing protein [bacterium]